LRERRLVTREVLGANLEHGPSIILPNPASSQLLLQPFTLLNEYDMSLPEPPPSSNIEARIWYYNYLNLEQKYENLYQNWKQERNQNITLRELAAEVKRRVVELQACLERGRLRDALSKGSSAVFLKDLSAYGVGRMPKDKRMEVDEDETF
jgi:hypothetical protein